MNVFRFPLTAGLVWAVAVSATAQSFTATDRQPTPDELAKLPAVVPEKAAALLKDVKVPAEFDVTVFVGGKEAGRVRSPVCDEKGNLRVEVKPAAGDAPVVEEPAPSP